MLRKRVFAYAEAILTKYMALAFSARADVNAGRLRVNLFVQQGAFDGGTKWASLMQICPFYGML